MKALKLVYVISIHILLVYLAWNTNFVQRIKHDILHTKTPKFSTWYRTMVGYHLRMDKSVPDDVFVFIGDSITQGLATSAVAFPSVNYGIGSDTSYGVLNRISHYTSIRRATAVVIAIGFNDVKKSNKNNILENYAKIIEIIPRNVPIIVSAILPVDEKLEKLIGLNEKIIEVNKELELLVNIRSNIQFVDATSELIDASSNLKAIYHDGDGIHLSDAGYNQWIRKLKVPLKQLVESKN